MLGILRKSYPSPAARLRALRENCGLTRKEFSQNHDLSSYTLRALENGVLKVSQKHIDKLLEAFKKEGVNCTKEWLLEGIGPAPSDETIIPHNSSLGLAQDVPSLYVPKKGIEREIHFFIKNNPEALVIQILDTSMLPLYEPKDYVGGVKADLNSKNLPYGKPCLVILPDDHQLVRILYPGDQEHLFCLGFPYPTPLNKHLFLVNIPLKSIYPIVWHRKEI